MDTGPLRYLGILFELGLGLVVTVVAAILAGTYLDRRLGTPPFFLASFFLLGLVLAMVRAYATLKRMEENMRGKRR